jgi:hypothetical protein
LKEIEFARTDAFPLYTSQAGLLKMAEYELREFIEKGKSSGCAHYNLSHIFESLDESFGKSFWKKAYLKHYNGKLEDLLEILKNTKGDPTPFPAQDLVDCCGFQMMFGVALFGRV